MKTRLLIICTLVLLLLALPAIRQVAASGKCTGGVYEGHPALVTECNHQQTVRSSAQEPYPGPPEVIAPVSYPEPITPPTPSPRIDPTEPPPPPK
jgi:hypothetical protein